MMPLNEKEKFFDVIIVGAGPGGLHCAYTLAQAGKKVVVLERNKEVGPKVCAGGLPKHTMSFLEIPPALIERSFGQIEIFINGKKTHFSLGKERICTVNRKKLGQWQLSKLAGTSATVKTNSAVTKIGEDYVIVNGHKKIKFKHLVGADGSSSLVRKSLGIGVDNQDIAIQYILPIDKNNPRFKDIELHWEPELFGAWYVWIFPHKEYVSIGCGCNPAILPSRELMANFSKWLKAKKIDVTHAKYEAGPINCNYKGHNFGKIHLVGDAAGLASGFTGEGIYAAALSGEAVAKKILDPNYEGDEIKRILGPKLKGEKYARILHKSGRHKKTLLNLIYLLIHTRVLWPRMRYLLT